MDLMLTSSQAWLAAVAGGLAVCVIAILWRRSVVHKRQRARHEADLERLRQL